MSKALRALPVLMGLLLTVAPWGAAPRAWYRVSAWFQLSPSNPPDNGTLGYAQVAPGRGVHGLDGECQRDGRSLPAEPCSQGRADSLADKFSPSPNRTPIVARIHRVEALGAMPVVTPALRVLTAR